MRNTGPHDYEYEYTGQRRFFFVVAVLCLLIGCALIGVAAYGIMHGKSPSQWLYVRPALDTFSSSGGTPGSLGDQPFRLVIDKIGVDAPVGAFGLDENAVPEVPLEPQLVAWYNFSAYPGTGDNAVLAGHVTWFGEAVFKHLDQLVPGDHVKIRGDDGTELVYEVQWMDVVYPDDPSARDLMFSTGTEVITVITCGGTRTEDPSLPYGAEYDKRVVVRAAYVGTNHPA